MKTSSLLRAIQISLLAASMAFVPAMSFADDKTTAPAPEKSVPDKTAPAGRALPFRGKVTAVDAAAATLTVGKRVFAISAETQIQKAGQPSKLADVAVGEAVSGTYLKQADGKLTAKALRFGAKPETKEKTPKKAKKVKEAGASSGT